MNKKLSFRKIYDQKIPFENRKKIKEKYKEIMGASDKTFCTHKNDGYKYSPVERQAVEEIFRENGFKQKIWEAK